MNYHFSLWIQEFARVFTLSPFCKPFPFFDQMFLSKDTFLRFFLKFYEFLKFPEIFFLCGISVIWIYSAFSETYSPVPTQLKINRYKKEISLLKRSYSTNVGDKTGRQDWELVQGFSIPFMGQSSDEQRNCVLVALLFLLTWGSSLDVRHAITILRSQTLGSMPPLVSDHWFYSEIHDYVALHSLNMEWWVSSQLFANFWI